jgi:hypothetical protein
LLGGVGIFAFFCEIYLVDWILRGEGGRWEAYLEGKIWVKGFFVLPGWDSRSNYIQKSILYYN